MLPQVYRLRALTLSAHALKDAALLLLLHRYAQVEWKHLGPAWVLLAFMGLTTELAHTNAVEELARTEPMPELPLQLTKPEPAGVMRQTVSISKLGRSLMGRFGSQWVSRQGVVMNPEEERELVYQAPGRTNPLKLSGRDADALRLLLSNEPLGKLSHATLDKYGVWRLAEDRKAALKAIVKRGLGYEKIIKGKNPTVFLKPSVTRRFLAGFNKHSPTEG